MEPEKEPAGRSTTLPGPSDRSEPPALTAHLAGIIDRIRWPEATARAEQHERHLAHLERAQREAEHQATVETFWRHRGRRYRACTLENFQVTEPRQREVLKRLVEYRADLAAMLESGTGLVLVGPAGTGKDHLLAGLCHAALSLGKSIRWTSGAKLWTRFRDRIDSERPEAALLADYTKPAVLVLSDPAPISGELTSYQRLILYQIIDARYNDCCPVWASLNAARREDVERALGVPIVDRLRHGAVSLACDWDSYRRPCATGAVAIEHAQVPQPLPAALRGRGGRRTNGARQPIGAR
jgi:DNA replication protein DnaC